MQDIAFETERLIIRPWTVADAARAFEIYSDAEVSHFIRNAPEESIETQAETLERVTAKYQILGFPFIFGACIEKSTGTIVGSSMLKPLPETEHVEVGWHLAREHWGKGYATESAIGCLEYGFRSLDVDRLTCVVHPDNHRSLAVARRAGFVEAGMVHVYNIDAVFFTFDRPK